MASLAARTTVAKRKLAAAVLKAERLTNQQIDYTAHKAKEHGRLPDDLQGAWDEQYKYRDSGLTPPQADIGYRKAPATHSLPGGWAISLPGWLPAFQRWIPTPKAKAAHRRR